MRRLAGVVAAVGVSWVLAGCGGGAAPAASDVPAAAPALAPAPAPAPSAPAEFTAVGPLAEPTGAPSALATFPPTSAPAATSVPVPADTAAPVPTRSASATRAAGQATATPGPLKHAVTPTAPELVTAKPGMRNVQPAHWERADVLGERKVRVLFTSGVAPCEVLDSVRVEYRPTIVVITLYTGSDPSQRDRVCAAVAEEKAVDVRLAKPLAGRTLVDGAAVDARESARLDEPGSGGVEVRPSPGAVDTRATAWDRAEMRDSRTVRIHFTSGTPPCMVLDRVKVDYASDRVTITLITGRDKAAAGQACTMSLHPAYVDVELDEPLANRRIVDGATD